MKHKRRRTMRVAIIADPVFKFGGAERVLDAIIEMFPDAHLFSLFIVPDSLLRLKKQYPDLRITTSPFQRLIRGDRVSKYISIIKIISWIYWELLDLSSFDLVISSSHSYMAKNVKTRAHTLHISYVHTPPRYLYEEYNEIGLIRSFPFNILLFPVIKILRWIDQTGSSRPDVIVVNSETVKSRVNKYYNREARVVYPNVDSGKIAAKRKDDYYVFLSRLVRQKGAELVIKTCTHYDLPLIVIGDGDEYEQLRKISGPKVKFSRGASEEEKYQILSKAKALIYASIEEDFGIVPIEALKAGVPVIAYNSGGVKESIMDGVNGVLFNERSRESLHQAIIRFNNLRIEGSKCKETANKYSRETFQNELRKIIREGIGGKSNQK